MMNQTFDIGRSGSQMLDYRLHYAILAAEDRVRSRQSQNRARSTKRIFRLGAERPAPRDGQR